MIQNELRLIARQFISSSDPEQEISASKNLSAFFTTHKPAVHESKSANSGELVLQGGIALSSEHAAVCVDDYLRTARYIKGTYQAIRELQLRFPGERLNVLYAGCGPYATIMLPLLCLFEKHELACTFMDINEASVELAKTWISNLDFDSFGIDLFQANAIQYKSEEPFHLLISETMFHGLIREPQVAIVANLAPQLIENGIMIPEEISLNLSCASYVNLPFIKSFEEKAVEKPGQPVFMGELFCLDKSNNFSKSVFDGTYGFESREFAFPSDQNERPDLCVYTNIRIFGDLKLGPAESLITNPICVSNKYVVNDQPFRLNYLFREIPEWKVIVTESNPAKA